MLEQQNSYSDKKSMKEMLDVTDKEKSKSFAGKKELKYEKNTYSV